MRELESPFSSGKDIDQPQFTKSVVPSQKNRRVAANSDSSDGEFVHENTG
jgi:hypothetical protein